MTYMLKTGYLDIYGLARFFSCSHWRAGECQSCTLMWLSVVQVAVLDHDGGAADGHTDVLRLLLTTLILILWLTNILAQLFHLALIYCTDVAERYFPTLVAQQQLDTLMAN